MVIASVISSVLAKTQKKWADAFSQKLHPPVNQIQVACGHSADDLGLEHEVSKCS